MRFKKNIIDAVLNSTLMGVATADPKTKKLLFVNKRMCQITGYSRKELLKLKAPDLHPVKSWGEISKIFEAGVKGERVEEKYIPVLRKDKRIVYCIINPAMHVLGGKKVLLGIFTVVTKLKKGQELAESLFEDAPEMMCITLPKGKILKANEAWKKVLGYTPDEIVRLGWKKLCHPDDLGKTLKELGEKQFKGKAIKRFQNRFRYKNGGYKILEWEIRGNIGGFVHATARDITKEIESERALLNAKKEAENYLDLAGVMFLGVDRKKKIFLINKKGAEILGYPAKKIIGKNFFTNFLPKRIKKEVSKVSDKIFAGKIKPFEYYENPVVNKKGEERMIAWHNTVLRDDKGNITAHLSSGEDITERIKAEEKIKDLAKFPEENRNPVMRILKNGILSYANKGSADIVSSWKCKAGSKVPQEVFKTIRKCLRDNELCTAEVKAKDKVYALHLTPIKGHGYLNVYGYDISIQKKQQREIEIWNKELKKRVEEKTNEIKQSQEQILQMEKLASIGELGAGIAHELNSPLAGVLSLVRSNKKEKIPGTLEYEDLEDIEKACEFMAKVIKDLSDFSRQSDGEKNEVHIKDVIDFIVTVMTYRTRIDKVKITVKNLEKAPAIKADRNQLQQVFLSLLNNSCDAIKDNGEIIISANKKKYEGKEYVQVAVADNGCGIKKENIKRLFDPFYTTKRPGKGVGLGLSIAYKIIQNHKGTIVIESKEGKGTKIKITLPVKI